MARLLGVLAGLWCWFSLATPAAAAEPIELPRLEAVRTEQGVLLNFETRFDLPPAVEDALQKGVALHFVAEAELMRARWYWRDKQISTVSRDWRLTYQPLTFSYRVTLGGLAQSYRSLGEALRTVQRTLQWRIADPVPEEEGRYYVVFSYRLDSNQLPRPLQISLGSQPDWSLQLERTVPVTFETR